MIRRVWEVLALQRHSVMLQMRMRAIDPVPHIHLHSGLRRLPLQRASRHRIRQSTSHFPPISLPSSDLQALAVQAEAVIQSGLAASVDRQRLLALRGRAEVKGRAFDRGSLASRNHVDHRQIGVSVHLEKERIDLSFEVSRHVPVGVVCHVDHRAACRSSLVF